MGTRANIGIQHKNGNIRSIYTHWDGHPSHHGPILIEVYNTPEKIKELLDLGDLSSLGREIGVKHDPNNHSLGCTAYGRDREEKKSQAHILSVGGKYPEDTPYGTNDYAYLFKDGVWWVKAWNEEAWHDLTDALDQLQLEDQYE